MLRRSLKLMTASCCLLMTSTMPVFAQEDKPLFPIGNITTLNAEYVSPQGTGTVNAISIQGFGDFSNPQLEVENYNGILMFTVDNDSFELDLSTLQIQDADKIKIDNLNYTNNDTSLGLNLSNISASGEGFSTSLSNTKVECQKAAREGKEYEQLLQNCFNFLSLNVDRARFKSSKRSFYNLTNEYETLGDAVQIDELKLDIRNGKFNGRLKGNISKGVTVKFEGRASYDMSNRIVNIKISKAKAGLFNVRGTIFKELEEFESDTIEVDEPNIYIIIPEDQE